jgi:hypothetical protein
MSPSTRWAKTDAALNRLDQAITRLERAIPVPGSKPRAPDLFGNDDRVAKMEQASHTVEARLDDMAERLQDLLEQ